MFEFKQKNNHKQSQNWVFCTNERQNIAWDDPLPPTHEKSYPDKLCVPLIEILCNRYYLFTNYEKWLVNNKFFRSKANFLWLQIYYTNSICAEIQQSVTHIWPNFRNRHQIKPKKFDNRKFPNNYVYLFFLLNLDSRLKVY